jgi:hypothetical protein
MQKEKKNSDTEMDKVRGAFYLMSSLPVVSTYCS